MARTIVSIVSEQNTPNYIFIKEMYNSGDSLMFITSKKFSHAIDYIVATLGYHGCLYRVIFDDENNFHAMTSQLECVLSLDDEYVVNLTGGTKFMVLAIKSLLEKYKSQFYYIPWPENKILSLQTNEAIPIHYRMNVEEFIKLSGLTFFKNHGFKNITQSELTTRNLFEMFVSNSILHNELVIVNKLRAYRNEKFIVVSQVEQKDDEEKNPQILGLRKMLDFFRDKIGFIWERESDKLRRNEIQYLTGGWFEEYVYNFVKKEVNPTDIKLGVLLQRVGTVNNDNRNDLDVVFTKGNKLFVIECKTGIPNGAVSAFKEIVYKATALKESLLGLSANSYIFALNSGEKSDQFTDLAKYMRLEFCDGEILRNDDSRKKMIDKMILLARE